MRVWDDRRVQVWDDRRVQVWDGRQVQVWDGGWGQDDVLVHDVRVQVRDVQVQVRGEVQELGEQQVWGVQNERLHGYRRNLYHVQKF